MQVLAASLVALALAARADAPAAGEQLTPAEHRRPTEQTFLTFPEWFLVFSPAEYAAFVKNRPPSEFPFFGHVRQYWGSYQEIRKASQAYPRNSEYHVMIWVIGISTTVEYGLRLGYETLAGRLSELAGGYGTTEEDRLATRVAQEYVDFIRVQPWYEFDFTARLGELWRTSLLGPGLLRKWERKYALTTEWAVKAAYGWALGGASKASYGVATPTTAVVLEGLPAAAEAELPELKVLERFPDGAVLATVPRYEAFTRHARALAEKGTRFREIAGNRDVILVSALVPRGSPPPAAARLLFSQPILTDTSQERLALVVPVASLDAALRELSAAPRQLEHVYDY